METSANTGEPKSKAPTTQGTLVQSSNLLQQPILTFTEDSNLG